MAWHFNNLTTQTGRRAIFGLATHVNPMPRNPPVIPSKHVFFQGRRADGAGDGHIHEFYWDGQWRHNDLTSKTGAALATGVPSSYMFRGEDTQHVMYQGFDEDQGDNGRINELWWDGDWHYHDDLTGSAHNAPLTIGSVFGYEYSFFDTVLQNNTISQRVVYETRDSGIHLLFWGPDSGWNHSALTDAPDASFPPTAYVFAVQGQTVQGQASQRVLYLSLADILKNTQDIHELTWNEVGPSNREWLRNDLTVLSGTPPLADSKPVGLMHDLEFTLHVFYTGKDEHLYELYWNNLGWQVNDLTIIGATLNAQAGGAPLPYVHLQQGTLNVNYVGVDGHIHALWREVAKAWDPANQLDLTIAAGGAPPPLSGDLVGFVFPPVGLLFPDHTQHIFYIAASSAITNTGDVIELTDE